MANPSQIDAIVSADVADMARAAQAAQMAKAAQAAAAALTLEQVVQIAYNAYISGGLDHSAAFARVQANLARLLAFQPLTEDNS